MALDFGGMAENKDQGTVLRSALFPVEKAVDDSVWDSGESGKLAETCSKVETGEWIRGRFSDPKGTKKMSHRCHR